MLIFAEQPPAAHRRINRGVQLELLAYLLWIDVHCPLGQRVFRRVLNDEIHRLFADAAGEGGRYVRFVFHRVVDSEAAGGEVQREVSLACIFRPRGTAAEFTVASLEIHRQFATGCTAVCDRRVFDVSACAVDDELIPAFDT